MIICTSDGSFFFFFSRSRRIRQHEASDGLPRGRLGRVRGRGWPLLGDDGGPGREGSTEVTVALSPAELPPRASSVRGGTGRAPGDQSDVDIDEQQLRAGHGGGEHRLRRDATWRGAHAATPRWHRARMGPVLRPVSSTATRQALQAVGRRIGLLRHPLSLDPPNFSHILRPSLRNLPIEKSNVPSFPRLRALPHSRVALHFFLSQTVERCSRISNSTGSGIHFCEQLATVSLLRMEKFTFAHVSRPISSLPEHFPFLRSVIRYVTYDSHAST